MKNTFLKVMLLGGGVTLSILSVGCTKDAVNQPNAIEPNFSQSVTQRSEKPEVNYFFVDSVSTTEGAYQNTINGNNEVYRHFVVAEKTSEIAIECHVFRSKILYEKWGDDRKYDVSKNNRITERLVFVADSAGLNDETTDMPKWYSDLVDTYYPPQPEIVFCYGAYFWQGYTTSVIPSSIKLGFNGVADGLMLLNNNKLSSWKGDVSRDCTGHRMAHLLGFDKAFFKKPLGTITTAGDTFTPFLNIFAFMDNKISSYESWSSFN
jgi:hypothetical protein